MKNNNDNTMAMKSTEDNIWRKGIPYKDIFCAGGFSVVILRPSDDQK